MSKEGTDLKMGHEFTLGHDKFEVSLYNRRGFQVGSCISVSRIQGISLD